MVETLTGDEPLSKRLSRLTEKERDAFFSSLTPELAEQMLWDWRVWAREDQIPPEVGECVDPDCGCGGDWRTWLYLAGRGSGKTRAAAEWVREKIEFGVYENIIIAGATAGDVRDVMVEGPSGIMSVCPPRLGARYLPTKSRIEFANGAKVFCYSADEPDRFRGKQCQAAWVDELASWRRGRDAWDQLMLGLRLPPKPRVIVTTTPRPTKMIRDLVQSRSTHVTKVSTYANVENLADAFIEEIIAQYEGTRLGRQELYADILDDNPGALWNRDLIDELRVPDDAAKPTPDDFKRIVVGVDPAVSFDAEVGDETGIIVVGVGLDDEGYVLDDLSGRMRPDEWSRRVIQAYHRWDADRVVAEVNVGGDMVEHTLRVLDDSVAYRGVRAKKAKITRAEPVAALYEKRRVHHFGVFDALEDQMCTYEAGFPDSPDRLDALVYALTDLMVLGGRGVPVVAMAPDGDLAGGSWWKREDSGGWGLGG